MRILLVIHGFPPAATGGTEIYVHDLARRLAQPSGDQVFVLARESRQDRPDMSVRQDNLDGLHVTYVNNTFSACSFAQTYRNDAIRCIASRLLDEISPDVAHVHHLTGLTTDLVAELSDRAIPVLFTLNDYWLLCQRGQLLDLELQRCAGPHLQGCARCLHLRPSSSRGLHLTVSASWKERAAERLWRLRPHVPEPWREPLRRAACAAAAAAKNEVATGAIDERLRHVRSILEGVDCFLAPSRTLRDQFVAFGIPPERISIAEQGIEHAPFRDLRRTQGDRLRVGFIGSLVVSKAPHLLLEAVAGLPERSCEVHVYGAYAPYHGDDGYREPLARLLSRPFVTHSGVVPHQAVAAALAAIDVLVVPSVWIENAPFVIREAFLAGVPVVASDLGGMAEMVTHETDGLLFPAGHVGALRRALRRLCEEPALLRRLQQGIRPVKSMEQDALETRARYEELAIRRRAAARPA